MGHVDTNALLTTFLALLGIAISLVIWAASTHAARIQAREARLMSTTSAQGVIDLEALHSVIKIYESTIQKLEEEVHRLREEALSFQQKARTFEEKTISLETELKKFRDRMHQDQAEAKAAQEPGEESSSGSLITES